jgi:hypothetical protein
MIKQILLLIILSLPTVSWAQNNLFGALFNSQEDLKISNINNEFGKSPNKSGSESMTSSTSCTSEQQTSLPMRMVLGLLRGKGATIQPTYDANAEKISLSGGPMISNCNSMLDFHWGEKTNDRPHTFEVRIKKPDNCKENKCQYKVQTVENERIVDMPQLQEFSPNMDGFINCLEKSGVYKEGKINKEKIVTSDFFVEKSGVSKSGEVLFVSRGPSAANTGGGVFSKNNKLANNECNFYEDLQKGGYKIFAQEDIAHKKLMDEAQVLCKSKNYQEIYGNLKNFQSMASMYKDLEKIMKEQLLKEVKAAKKEFDKAVKDGDLSKLDTDKYAKLFKDYYDLIVSKHFDENSHNEADAKDMSLLVNLYSAYEDAKTDEEKREIEKKIRDLSKELNQYMQEPYFTLDDFQHFISLNNKAPIKDPKWKEATVNMHKALITLRLSCQAYSVDNRGCSFSDKTQNMKDMASVEDIQDAVASYSQKGLKNYEQKEYVLKNPDKNHSEEFDKMIKDCQKLYSESNQKQMYYMQTRAQYNQMAIQQCASKNPYVGMFGGYGGYYANKSKQCIEDMNADYKAKFSVSSTKIRLCDSQMNKYKDEYNKWKDLEAIRDRYYNNTSDEDDDDSSVTYNNGQYHFNYTPGQNQMPQGGAFPNNQMMNPNYNPYAMMGQQNPYQNMYNPNMYSMLGMGNQGFNGGLNFNAGLYGMGGMGRSPSMMYGNYGMGMPGGMGNYMGNMTSPGGAYNFSYGF